MWGKSGCWQDLTKYNIKKATDEKCYLRIIIVVKDERLKLTAGQMCNRILILSFEDIIKTNKIWLILVSISWLHISRWSEFRYFAQNHYSIIIVHFSKPINQEIQCSIK